MIFDYASGSAFKFIGVLKKKMHLVNKAVQNNFLIPEVIYETF